METARESFNIGNFNSLMAIIAGLNMSPISRLKKTVSFWLIECSLSVDSKEIFKTFTVGQDPVGQIFNTGTSDGLVE